MTSTIDFIRRLNSGSVGLRSDWLARLQLVAENPSASTIPEVIIVESADGTPDFQERLDSPMVIVPLAIPVKSSFEVLGNFQSSEIPDTVVAPVAAPPVPEREDDQTQKTTQPAREKQRKADLVDLQQISNANLRIDSAHQPISKPVATPTETSNPKTDRDIKRLVDQIVKEHPPASPAILQFLSAHRDSSLPATVNKIAIELAGRSNERILFIDATQHHHRLHGFGLAELINRNESIDSVVQNTGIDNLKFMHGGRGDFTNRKTRPLAITKITAALRKRFQYVCIASPECNHVLTKVLSRYCEVSYLIVDLQQTDRKLAQDQVNVLRRAGARLGGCIVRQQVESDA